jgi:hypothetical protein
MKAKGFALFFVMLLISSPAFAVDVTVTAQQAQPDKTSVFILNFQKDSLAVTDESRGKSDEIIKAIGGYLDAGETLLIDIKGYADSYGTQEHNATISLTRAEVIRDYILDKYKDKGLKTSDFTVDGLGAVDFVADNSTDDGRGKNRRVELTITKTAALTAGTSGAVPVVTRAKQADADKTAQSADKTPVVKESGMCWGCAGLVVIDAALVAYAIYAVSDERSAADNYDTNYDNLNNSLGSNYDRLNSMKKSVNDKQTTAAVVSCIAGAALVYTAADYFWLHIVFPADVKAEPIVANNSISGVMLTAGEAF